MDNTSLTIFSCHVEKRVKVMPLRSRRYLCGDGEKHVSLAGVEGRWEPQIAISHITELSQRLLNVIYSGQTTVNTGPLSSAST